MENKLALTQTKAGRRFMGFMKAFNSGDPAIIGGYIAEYAAGESLKSHNVDDWRDELTRIYSATGGMKLAQVIASDEYRVIVLMQGKAGGGLYLTEMTVLEDYPHKVAEYKQQPA
jgi:hypothetical protein